VDPIGGQGRLRGVISLMMLKMIKMVMMMMIIIIIITILMLKYIFYYIYNNNIKIRISEKFAHKMYSKYM